MPRVLDSWFAWVIDTNEKSYGFIGRYFFAKECYPPTYLEGCKIALFRTRREARNHLPAVRRTFLKARVIQVGILVTGD